MMWGAGKYDALATYVRKHARAKGVILLVVAGDRGSGFSAQADIATTVHLPGILRTIADQIEADMERET